ncbi:hypothetical protein [Amphibacillus xylanus]|uniref:Transmembrane protein n=1 Tax=Amphibacillus xylanus (strain ATCC 51415 / DSM 6626 / JCM 7361 / LMG 17667 / NBRC 15112 / Ep01) TaxID=698758 RepID=K0J4B8_AMPXN|nr:hypothetical protein [Amphibacillus xylanus]BAM47511.1 hypothetical protein AXY_13790 [Amphibacillus xylanus NBRC 15112]
MYAEENHYNHVSDDDSGCWMYIVSIFIPFIGIILGLTYIAKNEDIDLDPLHKYFLN